MTVCLFSVTVGTHYGVVTARQLSCFGTLLSLYFGVAMVHGSDFLKVFFRLS